ncbi:MAG: hypothetical protein R3A50_15175 [Saprospiraceae bacterium]|nr:hypothetical protein [Saprospiraceae bacterium]MCB9344336.1 hypothetical protein [Lewinellaceae bacterium]
MNFSKNAIKVAIGLLLAVIFIANACTGGNGKNAPDVSNINVDVKIMRFDQDLFAIDTNDVDAALVQLGEKYPDMLPLFTNNIIHDQTNPEETAAQAVKSFISEPVVRHHFDTVQEVYGDLRWLEKDLGSMFQYYKYYFPEKPLPKVCSIISEFAVDAFTYGDSLCGIGLDLFLGENYPYYNPDVFPAFVRRQFNKDYICIRLAKALTQNVFDETPPGTRLLDFMLYNGKMLYITSSLLPEVPDSMIMGYTREQMEGCEFNESAVWARLLTQKLLYSSDFDEIRKLVTPSPNAPVVFQEAPGEVGNWLGWQIVKAYMSKHPDTSMKELLKMQDSQKFLEEAKYKPRRME